MTLIASCGSAPGRDGPPRSAGGSGSLPGDAVPRSEPRSRYGNGPVYEVFGKRYTVMPSSEGYKERGVASWYGSKFHGNLTSMRERYNMHAMTAAHKSLPLPSYVRVRNLRNNKSVVVRVNDRGPFIDNRIIDLSYAAARRLDMIRDGTSLVEVEAISFDTTRGDRPTRVITPAAPVPATPAPVAAAPVPAPASSEAEAGREVYVQVGAFSSRENAERRLAELHRGGIGTSFLLTDSLVEPAIFRVRIGPITGVEQYDLLVAELDRLGIDDPYLVTD